MVFAKNLTTSPMLKTTKSSLIDLKHFQLEVWGKNLAWSENLEDSNPHKIFDYHPSWLARSLYMHIQMHSCASSPSDPPIMYLSIYFNLLLVRQLFGNHATKKQSLGINQPNSPLCHAKTPWNSSNNSHNYFLCSSSKDSFSLILDLIWAHLPPST